MDSNSLLHTKWKCKYHIVFAPKYRRKIAIQNGVSETEVEKEMCEAIRIAIKSTEQSAKEFWKQLALDGKEPPIEVVIGVIARQVRKTTYQN